MVGVIKRYSLVRPKIWFEDTKHVVLTIKRCCFEYRKRLLMSMKIHFLYVQTLFLCRLYVGFMQALCRLKNLKTPYFKVETANFMQACRLILNFKTKLVYVLIGARSDARPDFLLCPTPYYILKRSASSLKHPYVTFGSNALSPFPQLANNNGRLSSTPSSRCKKLLLIQLINSNLFSFLRCSLSF